MTINNNDISARAALFLNHFGTNGGATPSNSRIGAIAFRVKGTDGFTTFSSAFIEAYIGTNGTTNAPGDLRFHTNNGSGTSERMRIDANGNVGIGTTSPGKKLDVAGEVRSIVGGVEYYMVPKGAIIMWAGTLSTIPPGWQLCDGTNGTPDLRDRFILGVSAGENPGATGGSHFYTLNVAQLPSHTHSISSDGNHSHAYNNAQISSGYSSGLSANCYDWESYSCSQLTYSSAQTTTAGNHAHTSVTGSTGSGAQIDNRPAFYKLAFICKL
jgi:microcystin-dependent protein